MPPVTDKDPHDYKVKDKPKPPPGGPPPIPKNAVKSDDYQGLARPHRGLIGKHTHLGTGFHIQTPVLRRARRSRQPRRAGPMDVDPEQGLGVRTREQARLDSRYGTNVHSARQRLSFMSSHVDGVEMRVGRHTRFGRHRDHTRDTWYWNAGYGRWEVRYHDEL